MSAALTDAELLLLRNLLHRAGDPSQTGASPLPPLPTPTQPTPPPVLPPPPPPAHLPLETLSVQGEASALASAVVAPAGAVFSVSTRAPPIDSQHRALLSADELRACRELMKKNIGAGFKALWRLKPGPFVDDMEFGWSTGKVYSFDAEKDLLAVLYETESYDLFPFSARRCRLCRSQACQGRHAQAVRKARARVHRSFANSANVSSDG